MFKNFHHTFVQPPALHDNEAPFKAVLSSDFDAQGEKSGTVSGIFKVDRFFEGVLGDLEKGNQLITDDVYTKYRAQRMRASQKIIRTAIQRRRDRIRAWKKYGDPEDSPRPYNTFT